MHGPSQIVPVLLPDAVQATDVLIPRPQKPRRPHTSKVSWMWLSTDANLYTVEEQGFYDGALDRAKGGHASKFDRTSNKLRLNSLGTNRRSLSNTGVAQSPTVAKADGFLSQPSRQYPVLHYLGGIRAPNSAGLWELLPQGSKGPNNQVLGFRIVVM